MVFMADYGALIIRGDGVIETCGAFFKNVSQQECELRRDVSRYDFVSGAISAPGTLDRLAHVRWVGAEQERELYQLIWGHGHQIDDPGQSRL